MSIANILVILTTFCSPTQGGYKIGFDLSSRFRDLRKSKIMLIYMNMAQGQTSWLYKNQTLSVLRYKFGSVYEHIYTPCSSSGTNEPNWLNVSAAPGCGY